MLMSYPSQWTPEVKSAFLTALAETGEVIAACECVNLSTQGAYRHRALDPAFAKAWDVAKRNARHVVSDALISRALNGWSEEVYYQGQLVGHRQRHDNRLILALMARLDKLAADEDHDRRVARAEPHLADIIDDVAQAKPLDRHFAATPQEREAEIIARIEQRRAFNHCAPFATREEQEWVLGHPLPEDEEWDEDEDEDGGENEETEIGEAAESETGADAVAVPPAEPAPATAGEPGPLSSRHDAPPDPAFPPPRAHHSSSLLAEGPDPQGPETDPEWQAERARFAALEIARFGPAGPPGGPRIRSL